MIIQAEPKLRLLNNLLHKQRFEVLKKISTSTISDNLLNEQLSHIDELIEGIKIQLLKNNSDTINGHVIFKQ